MGANTEIYSTSEEDRNKIVERHNEMVQQSLHEDGHSYSGCIGMFGPGIDFMFSVGPFKTQDEAEAYICDEHEKYEKAMAVRYMEGDKTLWLIGGWVSS